MIMYGVCMNLHVEFVRVALSFAWIITSILNQIQIAPKDQTKAKIFNTVNGVTLVRFAA